MTDREDPRRTELTRQRFNTVADGSQVGFDLYLRAEELEKALAKLRRSILQDIPNSEFELAVEGTESRNLFDQMVPQSIVGTLRIWEGQRDELHERLMKH